LNFSDQDFNYTDKDLLSFLGQQESQKIHWGDHWANDLIEELENGSTLTGAKLPWSDTHDKIRFRPGEVSVHGGMNGHFKSMVTGQMAMWFALQGEPVGIMSFEMPVKVTQMRMCRQAAGSKYPAHDFVRRWSLWNYKHLAYYDHLDTSPSNRVLGAVFYMAKDLGIKHIVIDSLMKCGLPYGERGAEKAFIDALCATAKVFQIHIHLVCHIRKPSGPDQSKIPTKWDIKGAGEITDLVDNVLVHWSDKKKSELTRKLNTGRTLSDTEQEYLLRPAQRLIVEKQRHGAYEGTIGLEMHDSLQFHKNGLMPFALPSLESTQ
jgi:twinkle protein